VTDNTDNTDVTGGNSTNDVTDNTNNTDVNDGNSTNDVTDNTNNTDGNDGNNTNDVTANSNNTSSEATAKVDELKTVIDGFDAETRLESIESNSSLSDAQKLEKKNEVLTDLVDKYDYKIVEVNKALLESDNSEERDELMAFRRTLDTQRDDYEVQIGENDKFLATLTPTVDDNSSNELKVLVNETNQDLASQEDFDGSLKNEGSFKIQESADIIISTKDERDAIIIKEKK